jgi:hypothetical protein
VFCQKCEPLRPAIGYKIQLSKKASQIRAYCDHCGWDDAWDNCPPKIAERLPIRETPLLRETVERPLEYADYLKTDRWANLSELAKKRDGYRCRLCSSVKRIAAHHRDYSTMWTDEELSDLTTLCESCHTWHHARQKAAPFVEFLRNAGIA